MTQKIYYKVTDSQMKSARYSLIGKPGVVTYKLGEWVFAPKLYNVPTRLFVFDKLDNAQRFKLQDERLFECHVMQPHEGWGANWPDNNQEFWNYIFDNFKKTKKIKMPPNIVLSRVRAILARAVKLIKEI